ncbi:MAG: 4-hydroxy-3-methylbut-2-enyl diphosphate reductase [Candidatus Omnitrophica bacterium]|nr:4-hydroxy-3-methylbut-2-enyl diphosphate reductase [Candidatus Omnitrophota bacterium]
MKRMFIAKNIGFCFGVKRAVETAEKLLEEIPQLYTIGDIVHNPLVIERLKKKGLIICSSVKDVKGDYFLVRSHGLPKKELEELKKNNKKIFDMTCPFVKKIHHYVENFIKRGYHIIIIGNKTHPEVLGIKSCGEKIDVLEDKVDFEKIKSKRLKKVVVIGQTTLNFNDYLQVVKDIVKKIDVKEILVINTICKVTEEREKESMEIAKRVDAVFVLGSKESSNTRKLYETCRKFCSNTFYVENFLDLCKINLNKFKNIGIVSGTSTPNFFINDVIEYFRKKKYEEVK